VNQWTGNAGVINQQASPPGDLMVLVTSWLHPWF
jgi:hypothetical protein